VLTPEQLSRIDSAHLPDHIAVIMDGNGRWAKRRRLPRVMGHRAGMKAVEELVNNCRQLEIRALTLYSFSSENWKRPQFEIEALMALLDEHLVKEIDRMERENIRFNTIGCIQALPDLVQEKIASAKDRTRKNNGMVLTLALSYGAREEIAEAARRLALRVQAGEIQVGEINEQLFAGSLETADLPDPDLLIRTSGELRISNFLLWQVAYTEFYFTEVLWPDFRAEHLLDALLSYQHRQRRFGYTPEQLDSED